MSKVIHVYATSRHSFLVITMRRAPSCIIQHIPRTLIPEIHGKMPCGWIESIRCLNSSLPSRNPNLFGLEGNTGSKGTWRKVPPWKSVSVDAFHCWFSSWDRCNVSGWKPFGTSSSPSSSPPSIKRGGVTDAVVIKSPSIRSRRAFEIARASSACFSNVSADDLVVLCFDLETTGVGLSNHRIIEIAVRDIEGGGISTMQTLVNPGREVPLKSTQINNITTDMVFRPDVPRFPIVAKALVEFVKLRKKDKKFAVLAAHNAKRFDVPFLLHEFALANVKVPSDWLFLDTLLLSRQLIRDNSPSGRGQPKNFKLGYLFAEHYGFTSRGIAHRAMEDVNMLSEVLIELISEFGLTPAALLDHSFSP